MKTAADLRERLFETMDALRDKTSPMDVERAKAISDVAQTIINCAKVEVDYIRIAGNGESAFIDAGLKEVLPKGITSIVRHRIAG